MVRLNLTCCQTQINAHMKIIIAPQGFKGGISGLEAARAIARGVLKAAPEAETVLLPVADGGDGTLHALVDATGGEIFTSESRRSASSAWRATSREPTFAGPHTS